MMKRKEDMSETTSDTGHAELADEPSMEDILASIRKIIADDDQAMDLAEPQALETPPAFGEAVDANPTPDLTVSSLVEETQNVAPSAFDENSVFNSLDGGDAADEGIVEAASEADDLSGDVMDLDISALLGEADSTVADEAPVIETGAELSVEDDALFDALDLEIPDVPDDVSATESVANQIVDEASSSIGDAVEDDSIFDLTEAIETTEALAEADVDAETLDNDDSLFDELEGLLADIPEEPDEVVQQEIEASVNELSETHSGENVFGSDLAAVGLAAASSTGVVGSDTVETDNLSSESDSSIDDLLNEFADNLVVEDDAASSEAETVEVTAEEAPAFSTDGNDLPLVKSLMEDLTEPEADVETSESSEDMALALSRTEELDAESSYEGDILDDILDMTLDSEIASHEEELIIPEPEPVPEAAPEPTAESVAADEAENLQEAESSSLMDIAAAAEQDAQAIESAATALTEEPAIIEGPAEEGEPDLVLETGLTAGVLGAAAVVAAKAAEDKRQTVSEPVSDESVETTTLNEIQEETADMPRAVKTEAILDDVTETATSEVFASLNEVVEEKAIKAERGDRIGDLVMEALRPMLKEWLDANLKGIVERAVTKEVKRISSGK